MHSPYFSVFFVFFLTFPGSIVDARGLYSVRENGLFLSMGRSIDSNSHKEKVWKG